MQYDIELDLNQNQTVEYGDVTEAHISHIQFPAGEKHVRITGVPEFAKVLLISRGTETDLMKVGMAVDSLRHQGVQRIGLYMPYVPYARQDRRAYPGDPISIKVFADVLNTFLLDDVVIVDPHSDVSAALIERRRIISQDEVAAVAALDLIQEELTDTPLALVAPDLGASKKVFELKKFLLQFDDLVGDRELPIIQMTKDRDPETGSITGFRILDGNPLGYHCLTVDDICDGGGTFLGGADVLYDQGAVGQSLYVTHGIFSKGLDALKAKFQGIYASDSINQHKDVFTIPLKGYLENELAISY